MIVSCTLEVQATFVPFLPSFTLIIDSVKMIDDPSLYPYISHVRSSMLCFRITRSIL